MRRSAPRGSNRSSTCAPCAASSARTTSRALSILAANRRHEFWPDASPYDAAVLRNVTGHRQITNAYLAALAASHQSRLATFDHGLSLLRPDVVELVD